MIIFQRVELNATPFKRKINCAIEFRERCLEVGENNCVFTSFAYAVVKWNLLALRSSWIVALIIYVHLYFHFHVFFFRRANYTLRTPIHNSFMWFHRSTKKIDGKNKLKTRIIMIDWSLSAFEVVPNFLNDAHA